MFGVDHLDEWVWGVILRPAVALQSKTPPPLLAPNAAHGRLSVHEDVTMLPPVSLCEVDVSLTFPARSSLQDLPAQAGFSWLFGCCRCSGCGFLLLRLNSPVAPELLCVFCFSVAAYLNEEEAI